MKKDCEMSLQGLPVAGGIAEGFAAVIQRPADLGIVDRNTILVCPYLSPVYLTVFSLIQGIVTEKGGVMSIAASIARENNLPAVAGILHGVNIINEGDLLRINGADGIVQIISRAA
ncbi:PEP-utilizing enzyme [Desulfobacula sp.]|uniref:PEP-utilizing enzyme n=1 Tax=Desulfobacula sp. TaxID=2593537 RepID=UPI00260D327E|nr:PEP-utilizing enzyme [Desulfobacula sp.]